MTIKGFCAVAIGLQLGFLSSQAATVGIDYAVGFTGGVPVGSLGVMVVDTAGDGFTAGADLAGEPLTVGNLFGADDLIVHTVAASDVGGALGFSSGLFNLVVRDPVDDPAAPVESGDRFAIYWFDGPVGGTVTVGQTGGFFRSDIGDAALGGDPFVIPAAPGAINAFASTNDLFGSTDLADFTANNFTVIPEPSSALLSLMAVGLVGLRRRR